MLSREERQALVEKVRYKHFKISWEPDESLPVKPLKGVAYATVAYAPVDDGDIIYGYSFCAPDDQFERKEGRNRAKRRLFTALRGEETGPCGQLASPKEKGSWPAKVFPPILARWLRAAQAEGIMASRWYYELPSMQHVEIEAIERRRSNKTPEV